MKILDNNQRALNSNNNSIIKGAAPKAAPKPKVAAPNYGGVTAAQFQQAAGAAAAFERNEGSTAADLLSMGFNQQEINQAAHIPQITLQQALNQETAQENKIPNLTYPQAQQLYTQSMGQQYVEGGKIAGAGLPGKPLTAAQQGELTKYLGTQGVPITDPYTGMQINQQSDIIPQGFNSAYNGDVPPGYGGGQDIFLTPQNEYESYGSLGIGTPQNLVVTKSPNGGYVYSVRNSNGSTSPYTPPTTSVEIGGAGVPAINGQATYYTPSVSPSVNYQGNYGGVAGMLGGSDPAGGSMGLLTPQQQSLSNNPTFDALTEKTFGQQPPTSTFGGK